ncbi:MAG TPA: dihydrofolate reductase family protein [Bacteroidales bacterium]|nr:dihydrofolate reductase family protein [Bacteroidales bacterium]
METEIIIHNSISLDSSLTGFMPDMSLHYKIAGDYKPDAHLIGSETIIKGIEMFGEDVPEELPADFNPPSRNSSLPWWVIVDSGGKLKGILHTCRRLEYCKDVIILVSEKTPEEYTTYLKERNYNFIVTGKEKVDLRMALEHLREEFNVARILTDTGKVLLNILLNMGMVNEISLLVHPLIIGEKGYSIFSNVNRNLNLKLKKSEQFENGCVWMVYGIES